MSKTQDPKTGLRRSGAVLAGLLTVIVTSSVTDAVMHSTGFFPAMGQAMSPSLWWLAIAYRALFTVLGGWVAARLDPSASMRSVWILTGLGAALGLLGVGVGLKHPEMGPLWYAWGVALTGPPCSWLGGRLHFRKTSL